MTTKQKLRAILDNLDGLDPAHRDLYRPGDGDLVDRFVLDIEEVDGFGLANTGQAVSGTRNARAAEKAAKAEAAKFAAQLKQAQEQIAELQESLTSGVPDAKALQERLTAQITKASESKLASIRAEHEAQVAAITKKVDGYRKQLEHAQFESQLGQLANGPKLRFSSKVFSPLVRGRIRFDEDPEANEVRMVVLDANGEPKLTAGKPASLEDLMVELSRDSEFGSLIARVDAQSPGGSAPRPGNGRVSSKSHVVVPTADDLNDFSRFESLVNEAEKAGKRVLPPSE